MIKNIISNFTKILPVGSEFFHANGRTEWQRGVQA